MSSPKEAFREATTMYTSDQDELRALDIPPCEAGAPLPMIVADEHRVFCAYYARATATGLRDEWNALPVSEIGDDAVVIAEFALCIVHHFGSPGEDTLMAHPLYDKGLRPCSAVEVLQSSWVVALERMNAAQSPHDRDQLRHSRHFILAFHDSTFECVAKDIKVHLHRGSTLSAISACADLVAQ
jgi:hypothetical protein